MEELRNFSSKTISSDMINYIPEHYINLDVLATCAWDYHKRELNNESWFNLFVYWANIIYRWKYL